MAQYCDTKVLEKNWFHWLLSSSVPTLELYRRHGLLWTKVIGADHSSRHLPNPRSPQRSHCIALAQPIFVDSDDGQHKSTGIINIDGRQKKVDLPGPDVLSVASDDWVHRLDDIWMQQDTVIPSLKKDGYILELPTEITWHAVLNDINKMCHGIAIRFKQPTEEEQTDLANEALIQVMKKLVAYRLVYTPGRAPVFNLLTTTIHRCMYSIMNKRKTQRNGLQKFCDEVQSGIVPGYQPPSVKSR